MPRDIDIVSTRVRAIHPDVEIEQLKVTHPSVDDDGIWYFSLPRKEKKFMVESDTGNAPFLLEHADMKSTAEALWAASIDQTVNAVSTYLSVLKKGDLVDTDNSDASPLRTRT